MTTQQAIILYETIEALQAKFKRDNERAKTGLPTQPKRRKGKPAKQTA